MATEKKTIVVELRLEDKGAVQLLGELRAQLVRETAERNKLQATQRKGIALTAEETRRLGELSAMVRNTSVKIRELDNSLSGATAAGLRFRDKMAEAARAGLGAFGLNILSVGAAVGTLGLAIRSGIKTLADFDQALSRVSALGGDYAANINRISEVTKTAGIQFGFTALQSVEAVEALAKAGVAVEDILGGGLQGALTLAAAGTLSVADAAESAAKAMVQFGLAGGDVTHIADLFANSANKALGEVSDITAALNQSGQVANQFGVSIEETIGTLTSFANAGLLGSDAGTSFRTMLIRLSKPTDDAAALMDKLGIDTFNAKGEFVGIEALAGQLQSQLKDLTEEQRNSALATIFGTDAIRSASILYKEGAPGIANWTKEVSEAGEAARIAEEKTNNLPGAVDKFTASIQAAILRGGAFTTFLKDLVLLSTEAINALSGNTTQGKSIEAFTAKVQKEYEKLGGAGELAAEGGDAVVESLRNIADSAEELATSTVGGIFDIDLLREQGKEATAILGRVVDERIKLERVAEDAGPGFDQSLLDGVRVQEAAARATIATIAEVLKKRTEASQKTLAVQAQNIAGDGEETKAVVALTEAEKKLAEERAKAAAARAEDTPSVLSQIATNGTGQQIPLGFTPEALTAAEQASQRFLLLQEQVRSDEIQGIVDFNLQRQLLDAEYLDQKIIGLSEYNARAKVIEDAARQLQIESQNAVIQGVGEFFGALAQLTEQGSAEFKAFATTQALINTYLGVSQVLATPSTLLEPFATISKILNVAVILATGLASVKKIQGFATGGRVKSDGGKIKHGDGPAIRRDNGDDVLITAKRGEVILNDKHQDNLRKLFGSDAFRRIGVPGFAGSGVVGGDTVLVGTRYSVPRPSPSDILAVERGAETRAINFNPVVSVVEINKVQARTKVIEQLSTA